MNYRSYTASSAPVSEVGFGAWQLGNLHQWTGPSEDAAVELVRTALDLGCNFFDTAPNYGLGTSERLLGKALEGRRAEVVINTKCGHQVDDETSWDPSDLRRSIEGSLQRLRTDYLDSVLLHSPPRALLAAESAPMRLLADLKAEGLIRAYGASVDFRADLECVLDHPGVEVAEVLFNVFHQEPLPAFARAKERGVGLIIKVPLDSGWLSGKYTANSSFTDIRRRWTPEVLQRRMEALESIQFLQTAGRSLPRAALAFILKHDAVSTVIPGIKNLDQLRFNLSARADDLSDEELARLYALYARDLAGNLLPW